MEIIDWTKYFDEIWCINYLPYKERRNAISLEFERIGILNHPNFKFNDTFNSPWYDFMFQCINQTKTGILLNPNELKCAIGHYSCIKKSLINNRNRILIIEDDSRFLKDLSKIKEILDNIPENGDIILFDYFVHCSNEEFKKYKLDKVNNFYSKYENLASCGCYSLSNKALKYFEKIYESKLLPADVYTSKINFNNELNKYFSLKNLSCQVTYKKSMSFNNGGNNTIHNVYKKSNIDYNEYNMNNGKKYDYGDFIEE